jgi:hypothetical protein
MEESSGRSTSVSSFRGAIFRGAIVFLLRLIPPLDSCRCGRSPYHRVIGLPSQHLLHRSDLDLLLLTHLDLPHLLLT